MDQAAFNISVAKSLGRIETKIDTLVGPIGSLKAVQDRIDELEIDRTRNWWFTVVFAPALAAIQATMRHFGIHV